MNKRPLVGIAIGFMAGLFLGRYYHPPLIAGLLISAGSTIVLAIGYWRGYSRSALLAGLTLAVTCGFLRMGPIAFPDLPANHISHWAGQGKISISGRIAETPTYFDDDGGSLVLDVERLYFSAHNWTTIAGRIKINIGRDLPNLAINDHVALTTDVRRMTEYHTPGGFDRRWLMAGERVWVTGQIRSGARIKVDEPAGPSLIGGIEKVRGAVRLAADNGPPQNAANVRTLVLGESRSADNILRDTFQDTGLSHLLAISGLHISAIAGLVYLLVWILISRFGQLALHIRAHKLAAVIALPFPIAYAILAGGTISVMRASIMYLIMLVAVFIGRRRDYYVALAVAALIILLYNPTALWLKGFQLSFAAVFGMVYYRRLIARAAAWQSLPEKLGLNPRLYRIRQWLMSLLAASAAAFIFTAPITAWHFGTIAPAAIVANLAAVPIFTMAVVPLLLIGTLLLPVSPYLAQLCWTAATFAVDQVLGMALLIKQICGGAIFIGRPSVLEMLAWSAVLLALPFWKTVRAKVIIAIGVGILILTPAVLWSYRHFNRDLKFSMLDVQQGLSMLVELPHGRRMLVDGGGPAFSDFDIGRYVIMPFLAAKRIHRLDVVVNTHPHPDHLKGLLPVIRKCGVGEIWTIAVPKNVPEFAQYSRLMIEARKRGIKVKYLSTAAGSISLDGVKIALLNPPSAPPPDWDMNDRSLAMRFDYRGCSLLICSDMQEKAESAVLHSGLPVRAELVQIGHHGSDTSSSEAWVAAVGARNALISVGLYNIWKHPSPEIVARWQSSGARVWRTDEQGTIECFEHQQSWSCRGRY